MCLIAKHFSTLTRLKLFPYGGGDIWVYLSIVDGTRT